MRNMGEEGKRESRKSVGGSRPNLILFRDGLCVRCSKTRLWFMVFNIWVVYFDFFLNVSRIVVLRIGCFCHVSFSI